MIERVVIAQQRVFCLVACAVKDASRDEVEKEVNRMVPCGTSGGWQATKYWNGNKSGGPNPVGPCDQDAERVHWYLVA